MFSRLKLPEALIALAALALGLTMIIGAEAFSKLRLPMIAGPHVFPILIGSGFVAIAASLGFSAMIGRSVVAIEHDPSLPEPVRNWRALFSVLASVVLFAALARTAGIVIAGAVLFAGVSLGFERGHLLRTSVVGLLMALVTYLLFDGLLGMNLPGGPVAFFLQN